MVLPLLLPGGTGMTHDLQDLLNLIKELEERIIELEKCVGTEKTPLPDDSWYWNH